MELVILAGIIADIKMLWGFFLMIVFLGIAAFITHGN